MFGRSTRRGGEGGSRIAPLLAGLSVAVALTACGGSQDEKADQAAVDEAVRKALASQAAAQADDAPPPTPAASTTPVKAQAATSGAADRVDFVMPSFIGANLQEAQDKVQTLGVFFSVSHDLLGARRQVIDSNWKVCTQTPAAGTRIKGDAADYEGTFDFGAVKLTEACP